MNLSPLLKFCFLSLMLHIALAVHVQSVGLLDASQTSTTLDITTVNTVDGKNSPDIPITRKLTKNSVSKTVTKISLNTTPINQENSDAGVAEAVTPATAAAVDLPTAADGGLITDGLITDGLKPLNLTEINKSIKRTQEAIEKNIEGQIRLKLLVDEMGSVKQVTAMNSLGYGLDKVAIDAAWKLRFIAAKIKSQNVALETYYTVKFTITHQ